tara:strand:- start:1027 stop:1443 length:417 start_codon:yes stop_codon:yes gene_type:complete
MAIPIPRENIIDKKTEKFIGIKMPLKKSNGIDGYFESTDLTIDALKQNIKNLLNTNTGERVFQPSLGIGLDRILFENIDDESINIISDQINTVFSTWMPFITMRDMQINTDGNKIIIDLHFFLNQNPNALESVQVEIG